MMRTIIFNIFLISIIWVIIIDISGIINEAEKGIAKWLKVGKVHIPKPFSCSFCMTWWSALLYIILNHHFTLVWITISLLMSYLTPVFYNLLILIRECVLKIINWFGNIAEV